MRTLVVLVAVALVVAAVVVALASVHHHRSIHVRFELDNDERHDNHPKAPN